MDLIGLLPVLFVIAVVIGGLWIVAGSRVNELDTDHIDAGHVHRPDAWSDTQ